MPWTSLCAKERKEKEKKEKKENNNNNNIIIIRNGAKTISLPNVVWET
jgi:hypothetical protein